jgi:hypothetical protein
MNIGELAAEDVTFEFSDTLIWRSGEVPHIFTQGVKYLQPGKTLYFLYHSALQLFEENSKILSVFDITTHYFHPESGRRISDVFHIDLMDYKNSSVIESEIYQHGKTLKDGLEKLTNEIRKLNDYVDQISSISYATGLNLSTSTLRNLKHLLMNDEQFEKIDPSYCNYRAFQEVLAVNIDLALCLEDFFRHREQGQRLSDVNGMTEELAGKIRRYFLIEPDAS